MKSFVAGLVDIMAVDLVVPAMGLVESGYFAVPFSSIDFEISCGKFSCGFESLKSLAN